MVSLVNIFNIVVRSSTHGVPKTQSAFHIIAVRAFSTTISQGLHANTKNTPSTQDNDETIRNKILAHSLRFVPEHGWSKAAIVEGAKAAGYPGITHGLFTGSNGASLVAYFQKTSNEDLVKYLKTKYPIKAEMSDVDRALHMKPKERRDQAKMIVEDAVRKRLEMVVPYLSCWPQALAIMSLPPNMPGSLATLLTMVDDICYFAGDRSVDFNWYARRVALAGVYKATELYLIQDNSPKHEKSWKFLNNRLSDLTQLGELVEKSDLRGLGGKETVASAFITARNILGLNWNR